MTELTNNYHMQNKFYLTEKLPPYLFEAIHNMKCLAKEKGLDIIDFGLGNPDLAPPQSAMKKMEELARDPKLYGYSVVGGIDELKKAQANYYLRRFGVELDPKTEVIATLGAKEGMTSLAAAIAYRDNYIVVPSPSYPIHTFAFVISKSNVLHIEALKPQEYLAKFKEHVEVAQKKPLAILVNYPCNPTSEVVSLGFYQELVDFCKKHEIYIISDIAYAEVYFDEEHKPCSILQAKGAKDVAIEFSTVSKSFSLPGTRTGFAVGNKDLIAALYKMKSYLDYGSFNISQIVCAEALNADNSDYLNNMRNKYKSRAEFLVNLLNKELGWPVEMPKASMFVWTKMPAKFKHLTSYEFCQKLILDAGVAISPGSGFGANGEGYVRFSLIHNEDKMIEAVARLKEYFRNYKNS